MKTCKIVALLLALAMLTPVMALAETPEAPQKGGTLTAVHTTYSLAEAVGFNIHTASSVTAAWWLNPVQEYLIQGDYLNKGPRGTGENGFNLNQAELSADLLTGWLLESWEWSDEPMGVKMIVRDGVTWQANESLGMEARALTADDVAYWINSYRVSSKASKMDKFTNENCAEVLEDGSVFVHFTQPFASWAWVIGYCLYANVYPQEQNAYAGEFGWEQVTGTGAFKLSNYTTGVGATYLPNESWWANQVEIAGQTYTAPFVDTLNLPILGDISTAISALMAGQVDVMINVPMTYKSTLEMTCPELKLEEVPSGLSINLEFNALTGACANRDFRRALLIGTDNDAITAMIDGAVKGGFPFSMYLGESIYTPIDKLPDDVKELYAYDKEKAIQLIKDLGFEGATVVVNYSNVNQDIVAIAEVLADQWSQLGVNVQLNLVDNAVSSAYHTSDGTTWEGVLIIGGSNSKTSRGIENERSKAFLPCYTDENFNALMDTMMAETDAAKRDSIMKEAAVYFMGNVEEFGLVETTSLTCWWPWVKNYFGETDSGGSGNIGSLMAYSWIDSALKSEMGF